MVNRDCSKYFEHLYNMESGNSVSTVSQVTTRPEGDSAIIEAREYFKSWFRVLGCARMTSDMEGFS